MGTSDSPSFDIAFAAEFAPLYRYLSRRVPAATAEDITAQAFEIAYRNWDRFDASRSVRPWLYGIAANLMRHHWRTERRMLRAYARTGNDPVLGEDEQSVADRLDAKARQRELAAILAELRPEDREVLLLHAWADLDHSEIASALSLPVGTVKSRLHRLRVRAGNRTAQSGQSRMETCSATVKERQ